VFEDQPEIVEQIASADTVLLDKEQAYKGAASMRVLPTDDADPHRLELELPIRESPRLGEFRFMRFAVKVRGEGPACLSIGHDGLWGPDAEVRSSRKGAQQSFRYDAGNGAPSFGAALRVEKKPPSDWVVVTRDLYADFGEFTLTGLSFSVPPGQEAWFDHIFFARSMQDFSRLEAKK
jgi:biopolymer transport protein ExbB